MFTYKGCVRLYNYIYSIDVTLFSPCAGSWIFTKLLRPERGLIRKYGNFVVPQCNQRPNAAILILLYTYAGESRETVKDVAK